MLQKIWTAMIIVPCLLHPASSSRNQLHHLPTLSVSELEDKRSLHLRLRTAFLRRTMLPQDAE